MTKLRRGDGPNGEEIVPLHMFLPVIVIHTIDYDPVSMSILLLQQCRGSEWLPPFHTLSIIPELPPTEGLAALDLRMNRLMMLPHSAAQNQDPFNALTLTALGAR